jgi:hypothetical protein
MCKYGNAAMWKYDNAAMWWNGNVKNDVSSAAGSLSGDSAVKKIKMCG